MLGFINSKGYNIIRLGNDQWIIEIVGIQKLHGSIRDLARFCIKNLGFNLSSFLFGIEEMIKLNHNYVHFGINKTYIFSEYKKEYEEIMQKVS